MAYYYIDYTNGNNSASGLRIPAGAHDSTSYNVIDSSADATHFVDTALSGTTFYSGARVVVYQGSSSTVRGTGLVSSFDDGTDTITLQGGGITGMAANDNYYILQSWQTIQQYTGNTRTAGDVGYVRANMTHTQGSADITFTSAGSITTRTCLWGCNATQGIDPYKDSSDVRATIDFAEGAYQVLLSVSYWHFKNLKFTKSNDTNGILYGATTSNGMHVFDNCLWVQVSSVQHDLYFALQTVEFNDCVFQGAGAGKYCVYGGNGARLIFRNCTFDATISTSGGINVEGCRIYCYNCAFGSTNTFSSADVTLNRSYAYFDVCTFGSTTKVYCISYDAYGFSEHDQGVFNAHKTSTEGGTIDRDTSVIRTYGATSSAKIMPNSNCSGVKFLTMTGRIPKGDFKIWCPASETTITVYIRSEGTWGGTYPTAAELFTEATYVSNASTGAKSTVYSDEVLSDGTTWVGFQTTFTPAVASFAYVTVNLNKFVTSCGIYVDIKPVVS